MEPTEAKLEPAPSAWGELVIENGRLSGASKPLSAPLVLIGHAEGCDIRLHAKGVALAHCALLQTPAGIVLRSLQPKASTLLNQQPVAQATVQDGDQITVGPFRFRIRLFEKSVESGPTEVVSSEQEALRIQAAAVAAQQIALTEDEIRLQQRRAALEQQENQLARHLEDKRCKLIDLREETRTAREQLKQAQASHAEQAAEVAQQLETARAEIAERNQQAIVERRRLQRLKQRLKQRLHRHWLAERKAMRVREEELAGRRRELEQVAERLLGERDEIFRARLRSNGEIELGKRQLQDASHQFRQEQSHWEEHRAAELATLKKRVTALDERELLLIDGERDLADERQRWEQDRLQLEKQAEGLESRIRNQRRKLLELEQDARRLEGDMAKAPDRPEAKRGPVAGDQADSDALGKRQKELDEAEQDVQRRLGTLEKLSGELADQRLYLAEQCERLQQARHRWQQERDAAAASLEPAALELQQREQSLSEREQAIGDIEANLRQRHEEVAHLRQHLDAWQARLAVRATAWESERDRLLAELRTREELTERQIAAIANLRQRWQERRHQEVERLQSLLSITDKLRQECAKLRDGWLQRSAALEKDRRELAARSVAFEEFRDQQLRNSRGREGSESLLEQLRQRWSAEFIEAAQPLMREYKELEARARGIEERFARLHEDAAQVVALEADFARRDTDREHAELLAESQYVKLRQELQRLHNQAEVYDRQVRALNEEVERLARAMIGDAVILPLPAAKAA